MTFHSRTVDAARGKWRGILLQLGLPEASLKDRHGPCPLCGGVDRFRWDNKNARGTYICSQCGAGDGMKLAMEYTGKGYKEVANLIDAMIGNLKTETLKPIITPEKQRDILRNAYKSTQPIVSGDLAHKYLKSRGVEELIYPDALRFAPKLFDGDGGIRPALVAMIGLYDQDKFVSMHRTFLKPDGSNKAEMAAPRMLMPGELPAGASVMLSKYSGGPLGIAEGIETAMSASALYNLPVWSAINTAIMRKWHPPAGCKEVVVFADNDEKFGGQAAAFHLAHRMSCKGIAVTVRVPELVGQDFNDILMSRMHEL